MVIHKLAMDKYDIAWLANGEIYKMKKELTSQLWNKMGRHKHPFQNRNWKLSISRPEAW